MYLISFNGKIYSFIPTVVPVELISFSATIIDSKVKLDWFTATETNNSGFAVERATDLSNFEELIFIGGNGTTLERNVYSYLDESVQSGIYHYRLKQIDFDGSFEYLNTVSVDLGMPGGFVLKQNYPNPFNPITNIEFQLPVSGFISLKVFDVLGNQVKTLINEEKKAGFYQIAFDASDLPSGVYLYKLSTESFSDIKKMTVLK